MSSPTKRVNGGVKTVRCQHSPGCEVVEAQRDMQAILSRLDEREDKMTEAMVGSLSVISGDLLTLKGSAQEMALHLSELGRRQVLTEQRGTLTERLVRALVRHVVETGGPAAERLRHELASIEGAAKRELGGADA